MVKKLQMTVLKDANGSVKHKNVCLECIFVRPY